METYSSSINVDTEAGLSVLDVNLITNNPTVEIFIKFQFTVGIRIVEIKIELMMKGGSNVWVLKEFVGGKMVKKMKFNELFGGNTFYDVRLQYNSSDNSVTFFRGDYPYGTMKLTAVPSGVAAVQATRTVAEFAIFSVQGN